MIRRHWFVTALLVVGVAALGVYSLFGTGYGRRALPSVLVWVTLVSSWTLISRLAGHVAFGHVVFFGTGAYAIGSLVADDRWPWPMAAVAFGAAGAVLARSASLKRASVANRGLVAAYAGVAGVLVWRSLSWPLVHDAPILHYIAWRIGDGAVPYRDLFDMNQPGVYLLHLALLQILGPGDLAWRAFDLAFLVAATLGIAAFAARWGVVAAFGGALAFVVYHLAGGAWQAGQRDFVLCPFLLVGALGIARWLETRGGLGSLVCSGAAMGAAVTLKPHAGLFAIALGVVVVVVAARRGGFAAGAPAALAYGAAALVVPTAMLAWLAATGGLDAWRQIVFEYLLPLYARLGRDAEWAIHPGRAWIPLAVPAALSVAAAVHTRRFDARHALALLGVAYGMVHYVAQGKGWEYHLYPLAAFVAVLLFAGSALAAAAAPLFRAPLVVALLAALLVAGVKGARAAPAAWERDKAARVERLVDELQARLRPGDTVQVLDVANGGAHALLRLRLPQPSRFVYDFHFYHDVDTPIVRALRAELLRALDVAPPRFFVLFEDGWPTGGYDRLRAFPELAERLAARYELAVTGHAYQIHARSNRP